MSLGASTAPELSSNNRLDALGTLSVETGALTDELLEKIVSGEVALNFSYLPPRAIGPENLNIDTTKFPLVDDDLSDEQLLGTIDNLLDKLVSGGDRAKPPLGDPNRPPERVIYL